MRIAAGLLLAVVIGGSFFLTSVKAAHAAPVSLGNQIVCVVFDLLNHIGTPIPFLNAEGCSVNPPSSTGTLRVMKIVAGGTASASDFQIHVLFEGSDVTGSPQPGSVSGTSYIGLTPAQYVVNETGGPANYTATFIGDCNASGVVTVASSSVPSVCTITNTFVPPVVPPPVAATGTLTIIKVVSGGTATSSDFQMHVKSGATEVTGSPQAGSATGTSYMLTTGAYTVSETGGPVNYTASFSGSCPGGVATVATSTTATCTVTNTFTGGGGGGGVENTLALCSDGIDNNSNNLIDLADPSCAAFKPKLTVKKLVLNTPGGTATSSNFTMNVTGTTVSLASFFGSASGTVVTLGVGAFSVGESGGPTGYALSTSTGCMGIMGIGSSSICTLTNTFSPASTSSTSTADVSVTKTVDNAAPNPGATITYTLTATNSGPNAASSTVVTDVLPSGVTYVSDTGAGAYATSTGKWTIGTLANGSSTVLRIVVTVGASTAGTVITNTATIVSNNPDSNSENNSASTSITSTAPVTNGGGGNPTTGGGGGGNGPIAGSLGGGGNGPVAGSLGGGGGGGIVLGASTSTTSGSCDKYLTSFIKEGQQNDVEQVWRLQFVLKNLEGMSVALTGQYDAATVAAVHAFQEKYGTDILSPWALPHSTGFVYLTTRKKVNEIYCHNTKVFPLTSAEGAIVAQARTGTGEVQGASTMHVSAHKKAYVAPVADVGGTDTQSATPLDASSTGATRSPWQGITDFFGKMLHR